MKTFKDPSGPARLAIGAAIFYLATGALYAAANFYTIQVLDNGVGGVSGPETADRFIGVTAVASFVALTACIILIGRWIYRVNANAHSFSDAMKVSPGWNVGWFFVPIANLWKPFDGISQTWRATHSPRGIDAVGVPVFMRFWWGLWLVSNVMSNISFRLSMRADTAEELVGVAWLDIATFVIDVALSLVLIHMIRTLSTAQREVADHDAFA